MIELNDGANFERVRTLKGSSLPSVFSRIAKAGVVRRPCRCEIDFCHPFDLLSETASYVFVTAPYQGPYPGYRMKGVPSGPVIGWNSVSRSGSNQEPDGDEMEPRFDDVFKLPSGPGADGLLRRVDFFSWEGAEDSNNHDALREDLVVQTACGRDRSLASSSTLCRFERRAERQWTIAIHLDLPGMRGPYPHPSSRYHDNGALAHRITVTFDEIPHRAHLLRHLQPDQSHDTRMRQAA